MKKMFFKLISVLVLTVCLFISPLTSFGMTSGNEAPNPKLMNYDEKISYAQYLGISLEDALQIPEEILNDIIASNKPQHNYSMTISTIDEPITNEDGIDPAVISSKELFIYNFVTKNTQKSTSTLDYYDIVAYAKWVDLPVWYLTDTIATAWSSDFSLDSDWCGLSWDSFETFENCIRSDVILNKGVAHEADIRFMKHNFIKQELTIWRPKQSNPYNLQIVTSYAHQTLGLGSVSVGFNIGLSGPSISFEVSGAAAIEKGSPAYNSVLVE